MEFSKGIINSLTQLSIEARELYLPEEVQALESPPSSLEFLRDWVSKNIPFIVRNGAKNWPAISKWTESYLRKILKDKNISVAVTPNGYADAIDYVKTDGIMKQFFILPEERNMPVDKFLNFIYEPSETPEIYYLQKQNSNLSEDFPELMSDINEHFHWATEAFNEHPTAVNLWIGDSKSVSSLHKDPFENLYVVVSGWKKFILFPPTDRPWLPYKTLPVAQYYQCAPGIFDVIPRPDLPNVPWIDIDPENPDLEIYPEFKNSHPVSVYLKAGDILYLPSLWFHHVRQSDQCIAVNYWYDMAIDIKYAYFQLLENLLKTNR